MVTLLILYPELFACETKFLRKFEKLTSRLTQFNVVFLSDPRGYILKTASGDDRVLNVRSITDLESEQITHAMIFDDGEEFPGVLQSLLSKGASVRQVKIAVTRVVNIKNHPELQNLKSTEIYEYIGRGSYWGNPHSMFEAGESREEVIRKYEYDFRFNKFLNIDPSRVHELAGKRLGCFCKPALCHGDVLANFLNSYDDGR